MKTTFIILCLLFFSNAEAQTAYSPIPDSVARHELMNTIINDSLPCFIEQAQKDFEQDRNWLLLGIADEAFFLYSINRIEDFEKWMKIYNERRNTKIDIMWLRRWLISKKTK